MLAYTHYDKDPNTGMEFLAIAVLDIDDLSTQFISPGFAPAWSPDGSKIAFTRPSLTSPTPEIFTMDPHGANLQQVTDVPGVPKLAPTWSPDAQLIAYAQPDPGNPGHNIISVTRLADKNTYVLTDDFICPGTPPAPCFHNLDADGDIIASQPVLDAGAPAWSPVSNEILFWSGNVESGRGQIWKIDADGENRAAIDLSAYNLLSGFDYPNSDDPAWSPDGTKNYCSTQIE